jgi:hypothetical protein
VKPTRPVIVGESRQMREALVCGLRMSVRDDGRVIAPSQPPPRPSGVFTILTPEVNRLHRMLGEMRIELHYAEKNGLPTHVIEARIANAETILRGKGAL